MTIIGAEKLRRYWFKNLAGPGWESFVNYRWQTVKTDLRIGRGS